ncbi:sugar MFS transporter [Cellulomonas sp. H30R-01]|uniref:MFS transporter n=1 Tax=Cellulomonas sp. H30R-01 TaxID=2704467 RepID=UPI001EE3BA64|nr:MFS transporter [Cellulomonas sp. H30R-01]
MSHPAPAGQPRSSAPSAPPATPSPGADATPPHHVPDARRLSRARWLLMGLFALTGVTFSSWLARIPAVRDALDLSTAELGGMLLVGSLGALVTVTAAGIVVQRFGSRVGIVASTVALSVGYVLMGVGPAVGSVAVLAVGIFLNGVAVALGNVPLNVESGRVERAMGRTVIPQFHAAFSIGAVTGSGLGAAAAALDVPVVVQFSAVAALAVVWRLASLRGVVLDDAPGDRRRPQPVVATVDAEARDGAPRPAVVAVAPAGRRRRIATALDSWREPRTLLIGVVIMAAALSEGSANDWLSLAVVDGFDRSEAVGGAMLGVFVGAMTVVRLLGTRLIDSFGRVAVLRVSGVVSLGGLLLFGLAPTLELAAVGIVGWGFGAALAVPVGIAAASDDPLRSAGRVAVVSSFASVASLAAPPLLGLAAESMGARHALLLIGVAMVASVLLAARVAPEKTASAAAGPAARRARVAGAAVEPGAARPVAPTRGVLLRDGDVREQAPSPERGLLADADPDPLAALAAHADPDPLAALAAHADLPPERAEQPALALPHARRRHRVRAHAVRARAAVRAGATTLRVRATGRARATTSRNGHDR